MIGYLKGEVQGVRENKLIVEVNGVGYVVSVVRNEQYSRGTEVSLYIHTYVREDAISLFGFNSDEEVLLFEKLLSVSGVGPKVAMSVFKAGTALEIKKAIREARVEFFTQVSGVGKKGAQRIIVELKGKLGEINDIDLSDSPKQADAVAGLVGLGYTKAEALLALKGVDKNLESTEQIKLALKNG